MLKYDYYMCRQMAIFGLRGGILLTMNQGHLESRAHVYFLEKYSPLHLFIMGSIYTVHIHIWTVNCSVKS